MSREFEKFNNFSVHQLHTCYLTKSYENFSLSLNFTYNFSHSLLLLEIKHRYTELYSSVHKQCTLRRPDKTRQTRQDRESTLNTSTTQS